MIKKVFFLYAYPHWGLNKIANILQSIENAFSWKENNCILIEILLKNISEGLTDNNSSLVQVMARCQIGDKPSLSLRDQCTISQHWPMQWLVTCSMPNHYLNQCGPTEYMHASIINPQRVSTLRPRQNGCHFTDDIFKCIILNENFWISNKISLKYVT